MPRRMSFAKTIAQVRAGTKTVTRRDGWAWLVGKPPGTRLVAIEKGQGLAKGEQQIVIRSDLVVLSARRERLGDITEADVAREGFPGMSPAEFVKLYGRGPDHEITRIAFGYLDAPPTLRHRWSGADWLEANLHYARRRPRRRGQPRIAEYVSPFGRLIADLLGYVCRGLYHLPWEDIETVAWDSADAITIRHAHELATFDFAELTMLVVACHDVAVRLSVAPRRGAWLELRFSRRRRGGDFVERHPPLERHAESIRAEYSIVGGVP